MSKRSERREAERVARKASFIQLRQQRAQSYSSLAPTAPVEALKTAAIEALPAEAPLKANLKAAVAEPVSSADPLPAAKTLSEAQLAANRANAQLSTGATTPEGQARSSMNALKHGLTGKTIVLPNEDHAAYQHQFDSFITAYKPATDDELRLVQSIVDCLWRIDRIMNLETALLLKGHIECAAKFEDRTAFERSHLINAEAYVKYERQMRNLHIQEARLRRTMEKDTIELKRLQAARRHLERQAEIQVQPKIQKSSSQPADGFDFPATPDSRPATPQPNHRTQKQAA